MQVIWPHTLARNDMLRFVQDAGARYWPKRVFPRDKQGGHTHDLRTLGRSWQQVRLPPAYASLGVNGQILVDSACLRKEVPDAFEACDWYLAAFAHLSAVAEWQYEAAHGPTHSYALRLSSIPASLFDHAWANRIMLLLRAMDAAASGKPAEDLFGPLPEARFHITHDVDALDKTIPIRIKQGGFEIFNVLRALVGGKTGLAKNHAKRAFAVLFGPADYYHLDTIADMVAAKGMRSTFHLHVRRNKRSIGLWFMDPGYAIDDPRLRDFVGKRSTQGFTFGLHPSFADWKDAASLKEACAAFKGALGMAPACIRQHWLRFSLKDTWWAQSDAGFTLDYTLGFNDRTGFRAGAALVYRPWDFTRVKAHTIQVCPTIAMDSHFYAYQSLSPEERKKAMAGLVNEVRAVHGEAAILWHPHSFAPDYNWKEGFEDLLNLAGANA